MPPQPLYTPSLAHAAYQLRYSWTGWSSSGSFAPCLADLIARVRPLWEADGMRLLEHHCQNDALQLLFDALPSVSPQFLASRAKGRLDHAARQAGLSLAFSRKLAVRGVGENTRRDVEAYIGRQVGKERFVDPRFSAAMRQFTMGNPDIDLSRPAESARGRYWYNLHVVLVAEGRGRMTDVKVLGEVRDGALRIAAKKGHLISRLSVMPDHLHAALRPAVDESPLDVVFAYQNNLAYLLNLGRVWAEGFYVGTFGEYSMQAVRKVARSREVS